MLVNRYAAPVVSNGQAVAFFQRHFDPVGMARDRFVHRVVEHFGGEVVERALVSAADVHAGAAANRFKPLQHLDRGTIVGIAVAGGELVKQVVGHGERL